MMSPRLFTAPESMAETREELMDMPAPLMMRSAGAAKRSEGELM